MVQQNIQVRLVGKLQVLPPAHLGRVAANAALRCLPLKQVMDVSDNRLSGTMPAEIYISALTEFR